MKDIDELLKQNLLCSRCEPESFHCGKSKGDTDYET